MFEKLKSAYDVAAQRVGDNPVLFGASAVSAVIGVACGVVAAKTTGAVAVVAGGLAVVYGACAVAYAAAGATNLEGEARGGAVIEGVAQRV